MQACVLTSSGVSVCVNLLLIHKFHFLMALCSDLVNSDVVRHSCFIRPFVPVIVPALGLSLLLFGGCHWNLREMQCVVDFVSRLNAFVSWLTTFKLLRIENL